MNTFSVCECDAIIHQIDDMLSFDFEFIVPLPLQLGFEICIKKCNKLQDFRGFWILIALAYFLNRPIYSTIGAALRILDENLLQTLLKAAADRNANLLTGQGNLFVTVFTRTAFDVADLISQPIEFSL